MPKWLTKSAIHASQSLGTTEKQMNVLTHLVDWKAARGYPPTVRELAERMGVNATDVWQKLLRLRREGLVDWVDGKARTLHVVGGE